MFYSAQILAKKGPLGIVWLAAHMEGKLTRKIIGDTSVTKSIDSILNPDAPLALRLSGQLLLGVVRIYNKQVIYLFEDLNDTLSKVQQAFNAGDAVREGAVKAAKKQQVAHVTLPDHQGPGISFEDVGDLDLASVDLSQIKPFELSASKSRRLSTHSDHAVIYTPHRFEDDQFDVTGEQLEEHMRRRSIDIAREAPEQEMQRLLHGQSGRDSFAGRQEEEFLPDAPLDDGFMMGDPGPSADPSRIASVTSADVDPLPGAATPVQEDGLLTPQLELRTDSVSKRKEQRARMKAGDRRKKAVKDVNAAGQPDTMLELNLVREQLRDTAPIVKQRARAGKEYVERLKNLQKPLWTEADDRVSLENWADQPSLSCAMPPRLLALYSRTQDANKRARHRNAEEEETAVPERAAGGEAVRAEGEPQTPGLEAANGQPPGEDLGAGFWEDGLAGGDFPEPAPETGGPPTGPGSPPQSPGAGSPGSKRATPSKRRHEPESPGSAGSPSSDPLLPRAAELLQTIKSRVAGVQGGKKQRLSGPASLSVDFKELTIGGSRGEAACMFFDVLYLQSRSKVAMKQAEPYGAITVSLPGRQ